MVVTTRSAPASMGGVVIAAGNWTPRDAALPTVGTICLVVYDDEGDAWVPTWSGVSSGS